MLPKLLKWGEAALEKSINQPALPHAIVAINATELGIDHHEWNSKIATARLLASVETALDSFSGSPYIKDLARRWASRGVRITTVQELIYKYYSSFTAVRIPVKGRYPLMDAQLNNLHNVIVDRCNQSHGMKQRARLHLNANDFNIYLQAAFDHFANNLEEPFNFIEVALRNNPLPENLGDHILQLALAIQARFRDQSAITGQWIFESVGQVVASCILLDSVQYYKGTVHPFQPLRIRTQDCVMTSRRQGRRPFR